MSNQGGEQDGGIVIALAGALTIGAMPEARSRLLAALQGRRAVTVDCGEATEFDVSFAQLLQSARNLATQLDTRLRLAGPVPPRLATLFAEGGFHEWTVPPGRSAA
jgi:anti-anti-sigma regulatory factor